MSLGSSADDAEGVAVCFHAFRAPLPEHTAEVTSIISDLYAISSSLSSLEDLDKDLRYRRNFRLYSNELSLAQASLKYTLDDILVFLHNLDYDNRPAAYKRVWLGLNDHFWVEAQVTLATRLAKYKTILREIGELVKEDLPDPHYLAGISSSLKDLFNAQVVDVRERVNRVPLRRNPSFSGSAEPASPSSDRRPGQPRRTERVNRVPLRRSPSFSGSAEPASPSSDRGPGRPRRTSSYERVRPAHMSPRSPTSPSTGTFSDFLPSVPDVPPSPMTSATSATTATSRSANNDALRSHWAKEVFKYSFTSHPLPTTSRRSNCHGEPYPDAKGTLLGRGFEELVVYRPVCDSNIRVSFYMRRRDSHTRMLCKVPHRAKPSDYYTLPLDVVEIIRDGSCLKLCRRRKNGVELLLWTQLKFKTMEDMVGFHHVICALRAQDLSCDSEANQYQDYELEGEEERYGGQIEDDGYPHALRIYEDRVTDSVRLQAAVLHGPMKRTPVWSAFITHNLSSPRWIKLEGSQTVVMRNLKPVVFMSADDYLPPQTRHGSLVVKFKTVSDATDFMDVVRELSLKRR